MINVLVTGANGQLGQCIKSIDTAEFNITYASSSELDITNEAEVKTFFKTNNFNWCINCAAYTAVDKAESEPESANKINYLGAKYLAETCNEHQVKLIHISTDFVFNGKHYKAYTENNPTEPIGVYGETKLKGEQAVSKVFSNYFIIRTSWLYSEFGHNFLKTMVRLSKDRKELNIVSDQIGTPTYAKDLASVILQIIKTENSNYGIYHYSNEGVASWYDFASTIFDIINAEVKVFPILSKQYPTPAKRPHFSVLDKTKIKDTFNIEIPHWRESLKTAITNLER